MANLVEKRQILKDNGYSYNFDRELYVNKSFKKAFSVEYIEDEPKEKIERLASDRSGSGEWTFYFNTTPSEAVEQELAKMFG